MSLRLSFASWDHDRALPLHDGTVSIPGVTIDSQIATTGTLFPLAVGDAPYDITELSFASYIIQLARGTSKYIGLPVYLSRAFRHGAIYIRDDRGISSPRDLEGKIVGIPEFGMTLAIWVRGLLADEYDVDVDSCRYRTAGLNVPGRVERLKLNLPDQIEVQPLGPTATLNQALLAGELDAVIAPNPPQAFVDGYRGVRRLIDPTMPVEQAYFTKTGIFPIMHIVGVRRDVANAHPSLCQDLYDGFTEARAIAMDRVRDIAEGSSMRAMSPWFADAYEAAVSIMGKNYWPYGIAANRPTLSAMCRYMFEQHLTPRCLDIEELFAPIRE